MKAVFKQSLLKSAFNLVKIEHTFTRFSLNGLKILWNKKLQCVTICFYENFVIDKTNTVSISWFFPSTWEITKSRNNSLFFLCRFILISLFKLFLFSLSDKWDFAGSSHKALIVCLLHIAYMRFKRTLYHNKHSWKLYILISCTNKYL